MANSRSHSPLRYLRTAALDGTYLVLGLAVGTFTFSLVVTGIATGLGLAITLVGIPILLATLVAVRWLARVERHRAALVLGHPITSPERPLEGTIWQRSKTLLSDSTTWLGTLWTLLLLPLGVAGFTVWVTVWSTALGLATSPAWQWASGDSGDLDVPFLTSTAAGYSVLRVLTGLALIPVAYWISRGFAVGTARLAELLLGEREEPTRVLPTSPAVA